MIKPKKVLILGSGALKIGEAGEFDYSGTQAVKAMKEEGIATVLVNPNIATIQTSRAFADTIYFLPVTADFVTKIIRKEKPDGILLGFGGQTALNCGMELARANVLEKHKVRVLGTPITAIEKTEDRLAFRKYIQGLGLNVPGSDVAVSMQEARDIAKTVSYPVIIRSGFSLGGLGSGIARNEKELLALAEKSLALAPQILIEEYMEHWKEIEYEVVRDSRDNAITVCNMENFDPMGIHTGESIVVAPSQTLTNSEYHRLREIAIKVVKGLPIIGECNIQYAVSPKTNDYRIIEVNARLSRSSALASKATGYPLAYVAAKLSLGYTLSEIPNQVTRATKAFFEPALDYIVVKIPRWDFLKFKDVDEAIGTEMQSVGEVMGIGRTFAEAFQKAIRSLDLEYEGIIADDLHPRSRTFEAFRELSATPSRPYNIAYNLFHGQTVEVIHKKTGIDPWFLSQIKKIVDSYHQLLKAAQKSTPASRQGGPASRQGGLTKDLLTSAKKTGFSDKQLGIIFGLSWQAVRKKRIAWGILPRICQIDTLAAEFPAKTNYLYLSYHRLRHDVTPGGKKQVAVIGGGPYQIGSSVEFDWCAVTSVSTLKRNGYRTIMINCNPETVSTDYDISDKLYFEELSAERIMDIVEYEKCPLIVSVGGQLPNTLANTLAAEKITFLGNTPERIDRVEDRQKFSTLLDQLHIRQPIWAKLTSKEEALSFADNIGFPLLARPSYVLSGRAMFVAYSKAVLENYLDQSTSIINGQYPMVISKFIRGAKEVDVDAVAKDGDVKVWAISEHVEHAGVHSGDATLVLPTFSLSDEAVEQIKNMTRKIAKSLSVTGPINIQFLVNEDGRSVPEVLVIEANLRASRSFPFVSKVLGINFIELATECMLGKNVKEVHLKRPPYFGVKVPHFSFTRLRQVDPVLRVEMTSTGEVACFGDTMQEAYLKALLSTGIPWPRKGALLSLGGDEGKQKLLHTARILHEHGFTLYGTEKTTRFLRAHQIPSTRVHKVYEEKSPNVVDLIRDRTVDLVINVSDRSDLGMKELSKQITDGYRIRRASVDANVALFTKSTIANLFVNALSKYGKDELQVKSWDEYVKHLRVKTRKSKVK